MSPTRSHAAASAGFTLVEIMIGLLISIISTLVVAQVFAIFEGQKRTVTAGGDAQINGAIALYTLLRDVRQSGYAVSNFNLIGCDTTLGSGVVLTAMAPVTINHAAIPAGDANTDTLLLAYGSGASSPEGDGITARPSQAVYTVQTPTSFAVGDWVAAAPSANASVACGGLVLETVASIAGSNVTVNTGAAGAVSRLYNLGSAPKFLAYAVRGGNLTLCDYQANDCGAAGNANNSAIWVPIVSNIVGLRAQYGRDTSGPPMDGIVDVYDQTTPADNCGWVRASAVRLVLVARSGQPEKDTVTAATPTWAGSADIPIDLSATAVPSGFTWQNFRYKVFETMVPIRNVMLLGVQTGC